MNVVGLDLSLTSTGVASLLFEPMTMRVQTKLKGPQRLIYLRDRIRALAEEHELAALEGYSYASVNQAHQAGELGGVIRVALWEAGVPFVVVAPKQRAKYATGNGNAGKDAVLAAAVHRSGMELGNDEADAWWLMAMALDHYGEPVVEMPKVNREVLDKIEWPSLKGEEVA